MSFAFKDGDRPGKYLFLKKDVPTTVQLLEDLGQIPAVGKFAENEAGEQQFWEALKVKTVDGRETILTGGWRLRRDLQAALVESKNPQPIVEITMTYKIETLKSGPKAVKVYAVKEVSAFPASPEPTDF